MRISTAKFHEHTITSILNTQSQLEETQNRLATGKRMLSPSDDPAAATRALELRQAIATTDQYQNNSDAATSRLNLEEASLMGVGDILKRVRDLTIQANNAGLSDSDRHVIAVEMRQNFDALVGLANSRDANGEYLFSGYQSQTEPFKVNNSKVTYLGDQGNRFLQIADSDQVAAGDSGWDIFMDIPTGNGNGVFTTAPTANNHGSGTIEPGVVTNFPAWKPDTYTVSFTTDDTYEIRDSAGGMIGQGAYRSGDAIAFRGIQTSITGIPVLGDNFTISSVGSNPNNTGTGVMEHSTVVDSTIWKQDIYTMTFSSNTDYEIKDSAGKVVGLGTYQSGRPISFQGIQTKITGSPLTGDRFVIAPGTKQDIFSTINTIATTLENAKGKEANSMVATAVSRTIQDLDQAHARVLDTRSAIGSRLNRINTAKDTNNYFSIQLNSTLSTLEDLDYTTAVSTLSLQTLGLQAAQQAYIKVSGLSLFNRLG